MSDPKPILNTPIEQYNERVWVKREDLCSPYPGPAFSKIRGVYSHILNRPENLIGVLDTYHSKAGWAVSYIGRALGKQIVNFYPEYVGDTGLRENQVITKGLGAELHPLKAGRSFILHSQARKEIQKRGGYMMPNALKLPESVKETSEEVVRTKGLGQFEDLVISVSSGTLASGILTGFNELDLHPRVWLHLGYSRTESQVKEYISGKFPAFNFWRSPVYLVDEKYAYKDSARDGEEANFPCNPYYDLKAWRWLHKEGLAQMGAKVLFWNIGA